MRLSGLTLALLGLFTFGPGVIMHALTAWIVCFDTCPQDLRGTLISWFLGWVGPGFVLSWVAWALALPGRSLDPMVLHAWGLAPERRIACFPAHGQPDRDHSRTGRSAPFLDRLVVARYPSIRRCLFARGCWDACRVLPNAWGEALLTEDHLSSVVLAGPGAPPG